MMWSVNRSSIMARALRRSPRVRAVLPKLRSALATSAKVGSPQESVIRFFPVTEVVGIRKGDYGEVFGQNRRKDRVEPPLIRHFEGIEGDSLRYEAQLCDEAEGGALYVGRDDEASVGAGRTTASSIEMADELRRSLFSKRMITSGLMDRDLITGIVGIIIDQEGAGRTPSPACPWPSRNRG